MGYYLDPSFVVEPSMTAKIILQYSQYTYTSTYRHLTQDELICPKEAKLGEQFKKSVEERLDTNAKVTDFIKSMDNNKPPHLPHYEDKQIKGTELTISDRDSLKDDYFN